MIKKILILGLFNALQLFAFSQIPGVIHKGPILLFDSIVVKEGDTILLGHGSDARTGDFVHIYSPSNGFVGTPEYGLYKMFSGRKLVIKHFKVYSRKKTGDIFLGVVNAGGLNCAVNFESAINTEEILKINDIDFAKKEKPTAIIINQKPSLADELAKLKKLLDEGAITKEEYEALKKKVIESN
jgi:hypothetical protein